MPLLFQNVIQCFHFFSNLSNFLPISKCLFPYSLLPSSCLPKIYLPPSFHLLLLATSMATLHKMILRAKYSASFNILPAFRKEDISVENWVDNLIELMCLITSGVLFALIYNHCHCKIHKSTRSVPYKCKILPKC